MMLKHVMCENFYPHMMARHMHYVYYASWQRYRGLLSVLYLVYVSTIDIVPESQL
jgi:hypothetical protein